MRIEVPFMDTLALPAWEIVEMSLKYPPVALNLRGPTLVLMSGMAMFRFPVALAAWRTVAIITLSPALSPAVDAALTTLEVVVAAMLTDVLATFVAVVTVDLATFVADVAVDLATFVADCTVDLAKLT